MRTDRSITHRPVERRDGVVEGLAGINIVKHRTWHRLVDPQGDVQIKGQLIPFPLPVDYIVQPEAGILLPCNNIVVRHVMSMSEVCHVHYPVTQQKVEHCLVGTEPENLFECQFLQGCHERYHCRVSFHGTTILELSIHLHTVVLTSPPVGPTSRRVTRSMAFPPRHFIPLDYVRCVGRTP